MSLLELSLACSGMLEANLETCCVTSCKSAVTKQNTMWPAICYQASRFSLLCQWSMEACAVHAELELRVMLIQQRYLLCGQVAFLLLSSSLSLRQSTCQLARQESKKSAAISGKLRCGLQYKHLYQSNDCPCMRWTEMALAAIHCFAMHFICTIWQQ